MKALLHVLDRAQRLLAGDKRGPGWTGPESPMGFCMRLRGENSLGLPVLEPCWWDDEAVWQHTVEGALRIAANGNQEMFEAAYEALRAYVVPAWPAMEQFHATLPPLPRSGPVPPDVAAQWHMWNTLLSVALKMPDLREWLQDPKRTLAQVLEQFDGLKLQIGSLH